MPQPLEFSLAPELLDEGSAEERAAFGLLVIRARGASLTEGFDHFLNASRSGPLVSGYHVAEWLAWNWWRLRWEPRSSAPGWDEAHRMTEIGEGYVWPNLTIFSDGLRTALVSQPSARPDAKPFRYAGTLPHVVPSAEFEAAVDAFVPQILGRLRARHVDETNLDRVWRDVLAERADPDAAKRRRLEALLGCEPEEADESVVERLVAEAGQLGEQSVEEVAAEAAQRGAEVLTVASLDALAERRGWEASPRDAVRLQGPPLGRRTADIPAWRVGADTARVLRQQEGFGADPISSVRLAALAGTSERTIMEPGEAGSPISFLLDRTPRRSSLVLRSLWMTGRRFDLARLVGDRLMAQAGALYPATRADTYRQKAQRSFAAEFLAPFATVDAMLAGDYSPERQEDVAAHFDVSPMTIATMLMNHGRIERGSNFELDTAAA